MKVFSWKNWGLFLSAAALMTTMACNSNVAACQSACAEAQERLDGCGDGAEVALDCEAAETCPEAWDEGGLDYTGYIDCVYGQYQCNEDAYEFVDGECDAELPAA